MERLDQILESNRRTNFGANQEKRHNARNAIGTFIDPLAHLSLSVKCVKRNSALIAVEM